MSTSPTPAIQLGALAEIAEHFEARGIAYWLFGGWAVDFHLGRVTRVHDDIDIAVWHRDADDVAALLAERGWAHRPDAQEDGYTSYVRGGVRLEVAFIARDATGEVYTPLANGRGTWPAGAFGDDLLDLPGVRARVVTREALIADKSVMRGDPVTDAKDRADVTLLGQPRPSTP